MITPLFEMIRLLRRVNTTPEHNNTTFLYKKTVLRKVNTTFEQDNTIFLHNNVMF